MPGWDSLEAASSLHGAAQILGLVLIGLVVTAAAVAFFYLPRSTWPERLEIPGLPLHIRWFEIPAVRLRSKWVEYAAAAALASLILVELAAYGYGHRKDTLATAAERARADQLLRQSSETGARRASEISGLQQKLIASEQALATADKNLSAANSKVAELQKARAQRRLSQEERQRLIDALKPFAGQKVTVASILGDDDGKALAEDFIAVFDAAGWDHNGEAGISFQQWDRDPVGVEVTLNEADARAGRVSVGIGALINVVRQLGLVQDNTIYMNGDVAAGQAQLKVGKKLRK